MAQYSVRTTVSIEAIARAALASPRARRPRCLAARSAETLPTAARRIVVALSEIAAAASVAHKCTDAVEQRLAQSIQAVFACRTVATVRLHAPFVRFFVRHFIVGD